MGEPRFTGATDSAAPTETPASLEQPAPRVGEGETATADPQASDLLTGFWSFDPASVERAWQQFIALVKDLGGELAHWQAGSGLPGWLMAVLVTAAACEIVRRRRGQSRRGLVLAAAGPGTPWAWWVAGLTNLTPPEEP
jgi:hypothetical protein